MSTQVGATAKKMMGRVALVQLDEDATGVLRDCFRQFGIDSVVVSETPVERLQREKFDALVLRLNDPAAEEVLKAARSSRSNARLVVYGIARGVQDALRFSKYCVNAVVDEPVERQNALRAVRATHLLVLHEFRRYVRVPIVTEVRIASEGSEFRATSVEISGGGMSLAIPHKLAIAQALKATFTLPQGPELQMQGSVCWTHPVTGQVGIRFDPAEPGRQPVREWIDAFIERG